MAWREAAALVSTNQRVLVMPDRDVHLLRYDVAESEGQPLYAERTPDAPPVTWVHQTCLVPSYDGAEEPKH